MHSGNRMNQRKMRLALCEGIIIFKLYSRKCWYSCSAQQRQTEEVLRLINIHCHHFSSTTSAWIWLRPTKILYLFVDFSVNAEKLFLNLLSGRSTDMPKYQWEISFKNRYKTFGIQGRTEVNVTELFSYLFHIFKREDCDKCHSCLV